MSESEESRLERQLEPESENDEPGNILHEPSFDLIAEQAIYNKMKNRLYVNCVWSFNVDCTMLLHVAVNKVVEDTLLMLYTNSFRGRQSLKPTISDAPNRYTLNSLNHQREQAVKSRKVSLEDILYAVEKNPYLFPNQQFYFTFKQRIESKLEEKKKKISAFERRVYNS